MSLYARLRSLAEALPNHGTLSLDRRAIEELLDEDLADVGADRAASTPAANPSCWRERIWTVPEETRLTVEEVAEVFAVSTSWVYKKVSPKTTPECDRLPHEHLPGGGGLRFRAGDIRLWIVQRRGRP